MSFRSSFFTSVFFLFALAFDVFGQQARPVSSFTLLVRNGSYEAKGLVDREETRLKLLAILHNELSPEIPADSIKTNFTAEAFAPDWEKKLEKDLRSVKRWKSGVYTFAVDHEKERADLAKLLFSATVSEINSPKPAKLLNSTKTVTAINLFATWAGPSRVDLPVLEELYEKYGSKGFDVVALDADDESVEDIRAFLSGTPTRVLTTPRA